MNVIMPHSVLVITTAQLHSTKPEFRFCTGSNTAWACHQSLTMIPAGNKAKCLSSVNHTTKVIHHYYHQSFLFNKVACLRPANLLKKRICYRYFLVNFVKFPRKPFLTAQWLLPVIVLPILPLETFIFSNILFFILCAFTVLKTILLLVLKISKDFIHSFIHS